MPSTDSFQSLVKRVKDEMNVESVSKIGGNASTDVKHHTAAMLHLYMDRGRGFADSVGEKVSITEVSLKKKIEEPEKMEGFVVCEIVVADDMLNGGGNIHGGCSAYLIDICSTLPIAALSLVTGGSGSGGVSQAINIVYHSPARVGDPLRIISTTMSMGTRTMSSRCEIWNVKHHRLVASGVQVKMEASSAKL